MKYKSIENLNNDIVKNIYKVPSDTDLIIGVPRSGMMAASILAIHTHLPLIDIEGFAHGLPAWFGSAKVSAGSSIRNDSPVLKDARCASSPLLFDDSVNSGRSMSVALDRVMSNYDGNIRTGAVYVRQESLRHVDIAFEFLDVPRIFEWNVMHHPLLKNSCVDIDGVLCRDPTFEENDDGEKYKDFLRNVAPRLRPSVRIGWLVTSRLECYRKETEEWLARHGIHYHHLVMLPMNTAEERRAARIHGKYKADIYSACSAELFIESNLQKAIEIVEHSGKCVLSVEGSRMLRPNGFAAVTQSAGSIIRHKGWRGFVPHPMRKIYHSLKSSLHTLSKRRH